MTLDDLIIMAKTLWGEARGEPEEGQRAVAHVIFNRYAKKDSTTLAGVCLRPKQFSCWNIEDPNLSHMDTLTFREISPQVCAVMNALFEPDFTKNSTHYLVAGTIVDWAKDLQPCLQIGKHLFFNNVS